MPRSLRVGSIVPLSLVVDHIEVEAGLTITARPKAASARCPRCEGASSRMHSRYTRTLSDLPVAGRRVVITVSVRRFRCVGPECRTKIFAERLEPNLAAAYARRTERLETIVHHLGLALGGRPAESFARRLMVPASRDTMLRTVRRRVQRPTEPLNVIGIDDWAFRRGHRYGTLICDLEQRRVVALLPDRESGTVEAWLSAHPEITVLARDRGGCYGEAAARTLPMVWRRLRADGFIGSLRVVGEWATRRRRHEQTPEGAPGKVPSARLLARLMTTGRDSLSKAETVTVATIEAAVPALDEARSLLSGFQNIIRERKSPDLDTWIDTAAGGLLASFAKGLSRDRAAVAATLVEPWSNGQTEEQVTRLKLVKRQMYGRAKLDLLEVRLIGAG